MDSMKMKILIHLLVRVQNNDHIAQIRGDACEKSDRTDMFFHSG